MDKTRDAQKIEAIGARAEELKLRSSEYLAICLGIKPPLPPPDKPLPVDASISPVSQSQSQPQQQQRPPNRTSGGEPSRHWDSKMIKWNEK
jgi:hypothetical protein